MVQPTLGLGSGLALGLGLGSARFLTLRPNANPDPNPNPDTRTVYSRMILVTCFTQLILSAQSTQPANPVFLLTVTADPIKSGTGWYKYNHLFHLTGLRCLLVQYFRCVRQKKTRMKSYLYSECKSSYAERSVSCAALFTGKCARCFYSDERRRWQVVNFIRWFVGQNAQNLWTNFHETWRTFLFKFWNKLLSNFYKKELFWYRERYTPSYRYIEQKTTSDNKRQGFYWKFKYTIWAVKFTVNSIK